MKHKIVELNASANIYPQLDLLSNEDKNKNAQVEELKKSLLELLEKFNYKK